MVSTVAWIVLVAENKQFMRSSDSSIIVCRTLLLVWKYTVAYMVACVLLVTVIIQSHGNKMIAWYKRKLGLLDRKGKTSTVWCNGKKRKIFMHVKLICCLASEVSHWPKMVSGRSNCIASKIPKIFWSMPPDPPSCSVHTYKPDGYGPLWTVWDLKCVHQ